MSAPESYTFAPEDDPFRNITIQRGTGFFSPRTNTLEDGDDKEEDPVLMSVHRKLLRAVGDLEELHAVGISARGIPSKIKLFLTMHKASTEKTYSKFCELYDELTDMLGPELSIEDQALRQDVKSLYFALCLMAEELQPVPPPVSPNTTFTSSRSRSKLPTIELITFDGQRANWKRYKDNFESLVLKDPELSPIDKFHYLSTSLKGTASAIIAPLSLTAENFSIAWQSLIDAYDNPRMLATAYLDQLFSIKPLTTAPSTEQLAQITNQITKSIASFKQIQVPDTTEFLLFYLARRCLDKKTREAFELLQEPSQFPTYEGLIKFLRHRCMAGELAVGIKAPLSVETSNRTCSKELSQRRPNYYVTGKERPSLMVTPSSSSPKKASFHNYNKGVGSSNISYSQGSSHCPVCSETHPVLRCPKFNNMTVEQRHASLTKWRGCLNCLFPSHTTSRCKARGRCKFCYSSGHHSLLHKHKPIPNVKRTPLNPPPKNSSAQREPDQSNACCATQPRIAQVMLGTAMCSIRDVHGKPHSIRLVMDSGSQFSFLTRAAAERLELPIQGCNLQILGIGQTPFLGFQGKAHCQLVSDYQSIEVVTDALVVENITSNLPSHSLSLEESYQDYDLADPCFGDSRPVDFLLGADLFSEVLSGDIITLKPSLPRLIGTVFGYVVMGRVEDLTVVHQYKALCATIKMSSQEQASLLEDLGKLWELEHVEPPAVDLADPEDIVCEEYFRKTHSRLPTGRFVVRLPFRGERPHFPSHRCTIMKRLTNNELKLQRDPDLKGLYQKFMQEYCDLGHMQRSETPGKYLIPHHGVIKLEGDQRKIRVVFDASARTSKGSLNDFLLTGPKLQNNIVHILLNFRRHNIVFTVDLVKMFRQVLIHPEDRCYQHILWRYNPEEQVEEYELSTITYGQAPAPYLAIRCIHQLVSDEGQDFPLAAKAIEEDMYVDDLATGADTLEAALDLQDQIIKIFHRGEFPLSKWASNHPRLLDVVEREERELSSRPRSIEDPSDRSRIKILGLQWDPVDDAFRYEVQAPELVFTKRAILSAVSRIYDPLGLLSPLIISAKALIQISWKLGLGWDDQLPETIQERWSSFVNELTSLSKVRIPRWVCPGDSPSTDILIFGDASELAYCAAVYLRVSDGTHVHSNLLMSKAKLAPVKTTTIPRLELCAALLASKLVDITFKFCSHLPQQPKIYLFTDSTVVLGWLNTPAFQLKTFVANRVVKILEVTSVNQWAHVRSEHNPSDLGSRGLDAEHLASNSLWFHGPDWIHLEPHQWPVTQYHSSHINIESLPERKTPSTTLVVAQEYSDLFEHINSSSCYLKLLRKFARILRFSRNCQQDRASRTIGPLSPGEYNQALKLCIKIVQAQGFNSGKEITSSTRLRAAQPLSPFLDHEGLLRVGGRVGLANLPYSTCHPYILPAKSHFALLIIRYYHSCYLHPGISLLLSAIRYKFWIIGGRSLIRKFTRECIMCRRLTAQPCQPRMANLPQERLQGGRPFLKVGVDFAGPFLIRESTRRKAAVSKAYMCIFICLGSKAVHIEAVSSMSMPAFLATLDRFISRRGLPQLFWSDNGTNFVGASKTLKQWAEWFQTESIQEGIMQHLSPHQIQWKFTPPHAPHFGGVWEAGVRSAKRLIRSTYVEEVSTFEELSTLFTRVEAILNSRPICQLTNNPEDIEALTPGHLLIGEALIRYPEPPLEDVKRNHLDRWQLVVQRIQYFWKRWKGECIHDLQVRSKWRQPQRNLKVNDLVLVQGVVSDRLKWPLGRILETLPGEDGVVRVVKVRTAKGVFTRPATKIIPLIINDD